VEAAEDPTEAEENPAEERRGRDSCAPNWAAEAIRADRRWSMEKMTTAEKAANRPFPCLMAATSTERIATRT